MSVETEKAVNCSFCGKSQKVVAKLIAGPGVYICNECVQLCVDIMSDQGLDVTPGSSAAELKVQVHNVMTTRRFAALRRLQVELSELSERFGAALSQLDSEGGPAEP